MTPRAGQGECHFSCLLEPRRPCFPACQFARVVKGVDLRSTAGNCARVRTPQLTLESSLQSSARKCIQSWQERSRAPCRQIAERGFDPRTFGL